MESRDSVVDPKRRRYLMSGVLALLVLLLAGLLLVTSPVAATSDRNASSRPSRVADARPVLVPNEPQTLTLEADPAIIPPNGIAFSDLTATVQDSLGDPAAEGTVVVFSTTLGTFPGGLTITPEPTGAMTVEAESSEVVTTGTWLSYTQVEASGGEVIYSDDPSAQVSYAFTATAVSVIFQKQYNAGIAQVFVDGTLVREIDTYWDDGSGTGKLFQQEELIAEDLAYAPHTIEVVVSGDQHPDSAGSYLVVDAFRVYGHDQNGAYLTSGGEASARLKSAATPGEALVTACAGLACDSTTVYFVWPEAQNLSLSADRSPILANGLSTSTLTAEVLNPLDEPVADGTVVVFSTTLGTLPGGLTLTPQPTGVMTVEAESGDVIQTGSWVEWAETQASDGKILYSDSAGNRLTLPFTATAISVIFQRQGHAGIARVYVDGILHRRIDTYSATTLYQQEELIVEDLPYAPHIIEVRVTGNQNAASSGAYLLVDAFRIYGHNQNGAYLTHGGTAALPLTSAITPGTAQAAACAYPACDSTPVEMVSAGPVTLSLTASPTSILANGVSTSSLTADVLNGIGESVVDGTVVVFSTTQGTFPGGLTLTPEPTGVMTIEAESGDVTQTGAWVEWAEAQASDGKILYSDSAGNRLTLPFTGTAVSIIFQKQDNAGIARVFVDGVFRRRIDTYSATAQYQQEELIIEGLPYAPHVIEVRVTGNQNVASSGAYLLVDAFRIYGHDQNGAYLTNGGIAAVALTSAITPGTAQVVACADPACDSTPVEMVSAGPVTLDLTADPTSIQADGVSTSLLTAHVLQGLGGPILDGTVVVFSTTLGTLPGGLTLTPEPTGMMTIEAEGGDVTGTGSWIEYSDILASDGKSVYSNGVGDKVTYAFTGTAVSVLFQKQFNAGIARVYLDGALYREIDTYSAATLYQQEETIAEGLPYAPHTIEIVVTGMQNPASSDSYLVVDAIRVYGHDRDGAYLTSSGIATTTLTSATSGGTAQVTACAGSVCDSTSVDFHFFSYLPLVLKDEDEPPSPPPVLPCYPQELAMIGVGETPHGVAVNSAAQRFYIANHDDDTLSVISGTTFSEIATVAAGDGPKQVAYNAATDKIYITNRNSSSVTVLRGSDHGLEETVGVGLLPNGVAVNENTNQVYVANWGSGTVSILDGATDTLSQTVSVGAEPSMVAVNPATNKAYVTLHGEGKIAVIDGAGAATQVNIFSSAPYGIAVDTVRNLVYVATIDSYRIVAIDGSTDTFLGWAEIRRLPGTEPVPLRMIAVNPYIGSSGHIFVTTAEEDTGWNRLLLLPKGWPEYFARAHALALNEPREGLAFDASTQQVWATSRSDDMVAVYLDGEPACPNNFAPARGYQIKVCIADQKGACKEKLTR